MSDFESESDSDSNGSDVLTFNTPVKFIAKKRIRRSQDDDDSDDSSDDESSVGEMRR